MSAAGTCFKCRDQKPAIISRDGKKKCYCVACFKYYVFNLFRTSTPKNVFTDDSSADGAIIIAISGGRSSVLLLHWLCDLRDYYEKNDHINAKSDFIAMYVQGLNDDDSGMEASRREFLLAVCAERNVQLKFVSIQDCLQDHQFSTETLLDHRLLFLRMALIQQAKLCGVRRIFVGGDAAALATLALYYVSVGGAHLYWRVSAEMETICAINIFRPLRNLLSTEVALATHFHGIRYFKRSPRFKTKLGDVQHSILGFMSTINVQFKSTIFNVLRTVDKIQPLMEVERSSESTDEATGCFVCFRTPNSSTDTEAESSTHVCAQCQAILT